MADLRDAAALSPVEYRAGVWLKRDDAYTFAGRRGGKVRTCLQLASRAEHGLVTAGSRQSPQVEIVASVAAALGLRCWCHVPAGPATEQIANAAAAGATMVPARPGYNSVIVARARADAERRGWTLIPFGMECLEAVDATAGQVANVVPLPWRRLVIPVGSGMSLAGVLRGLELAGDRRPVLGVQLGANPESRLDQWAPLWRLQGVQLQQSQLDYHAGADPAELDGVPLDPIYEAKCLPYLEPGDLLWIVGRRGDA